MELDPIAAVTHPDPYPYYADLVAYQSIYYDQKLGWWIASSAATVQAVLTHEACRVRPLDEPVPLAIAGTATGSIFSQLIRMNDGEYHHRVKPSVISTLARLDSTQIQHWAKVLLDHCSLTDFMFHLPVYVIASALGMSEQQLPQIALWVRQLVASFATGEQNSAADHLLELFRGEANTIGLLTQSYEATAGLIGNSLVRIATDQTLREQVKDYPHLLNAVIQEVARYDSPVQNSRRFLAEDAVIAGHNMHQGDKILVLLAAANRDPAANPHAERFDLFRNTRQCFTFGVGIHACPGEKLATVIATAGVEAVMSAGIPINPNISYRLSVNTRIPEGL